MHSAFHVSGSTSSHQILRKNCVHIARGEIPDVGVKAMKRGTLYGNRANRSSKGSEDQKKYAKLALAEFESIIKLLDPDKNIEVYLTVLLKNHK